jgi:hypothetical protein
LLDGHSTPVGVVASVLVYGAWALGLVAVLVPGPLGLTLLRILAPAALGVTVWSSVGERTSVPVVAIAVAAAVVAVVAAFAPTTVDAFVDASSYGPERRWALRVPVGLLLGPLPLAWAAIVAGAATGPLLLAARQWAAGAVALLVGVPLAWVAGRALHHLSHRWLVFVPAGVVVHDRGVLLEPVLLPRRSVQWLGPATVGTAAEDLTLGAAGLVIEIRLHPPAEAARRRGRTQADTVTLDAILVCPVRPGALIRAAADHRLPAGRSTG